MLLVAAAGCSSDDDGGGGSSTSAAPTGCSEAAALKDSVTALTQVSPVNDGLDALKSAAADVKTDLDATVSAVSSELQPSVDEVKSSFDDLESTLGGISDAASLGAAATEIGTELTQLGYRADWPLDGDRSGLLATEASGVTSRDGSSP